MKKKTILVAAIAVMLVAALVVGGTLAYFTDTKSVTNTFTVGNVAIKLEEPNWKANEPHTLVPGASYAKDPTITVEKGSQDAYVFLEINMNKYVSLINLMGVDAYKNHIGGLSGKYPGFQTFVKTLIENNDLRATVLGRWFKGINHADWEVMNLAELQEAVSGTETQTNPKVLPIILGYKAGAVSAGTEIKFMTAFGMPDTVTASMFDGEDAYYIDGVSKSNFNTNTTNTAGNPVPFKMTFTAYAIQADQINGLSAAYDTLFK